MILGSGGAGEVVPSPGRPAYLRPELLAFILARSVFYGVCFPKQGRPTLHSGLVAIHSAGPLSKEEDTGSYYSRPILFCLGAASYDSVISWT